MFFRVNKCTNKDHDQCNQIVFKNILCVFRDVIQPNTNYGNHPSGNRSPQRTFPKNRLVSPEN